jgi:chromosome partitioning protein
MTHPMNGPILEGRLADFNLVEVLQVLSLSRQYARVELFDDDRLLAGSIFVKSGKIVQAAIGALRGRAAFVSLIRRPPVSFRVFRVNTPALVPEPIGALSNLLFEALEVDDPPMDTDSWQLAPSKSAEEWEPLSAPAPQPQIPPPPRAPTMRSPRRTYSGVQATKAAAAGPCIIGIASPKGGSGKTTVALNLSLSLARREHSVILVDGDVNGDVMSSIDGRAAAKAGVFDVLTRGAAPADALRKTVAQNLRIMPAVGQSLPDPEVAFVDHRDRWQFLLNDLAQRAEIVLVDTPAGMLGITYQILSACTHVLGVLQAEVIAQRSFTMFADCLELLPESDRPEVLGVFLNLLQLGHNASINVLEQACASLPKHWLFETSIPRNPAFLDATAAGLPLHLIDPKHPPAVSWLFDTLATEVVDRLALGSPEALAPRQRRFLA